jgi:hypothetical protein
MNQEERRWLSNLRKGELEDVVHREEYKGGLIIVRWITRAAVASFQDSNPGYYTAYAAVPPKYHHDAVCYDYSMDGRITFNYFGVIGIDFAHHNMLCEYDGKEYDSCGRMADHTGHESIYTMARVIEEIKDVYDLFLQQSMGGWKAHVRSIRERIHRFIEYDLRRRWVRWRRRRQSK